MAKHILDRGNLKVVDDGVKPDYTIPSSGSLFSPATNLIPMLSGVAMGRVLLGNKSTAQAMPLVHRETPLVQAVDESDQNAFVKKYAGKVANLKADAAGTVSKVTSDEIRVKDAKGDEKVYYLYQHYQLGNKSFLQHYPKVQEGEKVTNGKILATSNYTDDNGDLAMGVNLNTAVMPWRGSNFEDAIVVSESGAKKLAGLQSGKVILEKAMGVEVSRDKYISLFPNKFNNNQLKVIGANGVVRKGAKVSHGDPLILACAPRAVKSAEFQALKKVFRQAYTDKAETWHYQSPGTVRDVVDSPNQVTIILEQERPMQTGDKLCLAGDHEVLAFDGWKPVAGIRAGDQVYSLNPSTWVIEKAEVLAARVYHETEFATVEAPHVSFKCNRGHRQWVAAADRPWMLAPTGEIKDTVCALSATGLWAAESPARVCLPGAAAAGSKAGSRAVPGLDLKPNDLCFLLGAFLKRGRVFRSKAGGGILFLGAGHEAARLAGRLEQAGLARVRTSRGVKVPGQAIASFFGRIADDRHIPDFIFEYSLEDLLTLWDWWRPVEPGRVYFAPTVRLANDLQRLLLHIGCCGEVKENTVWRSDANPLNLRINTGGNDAVKFAAGDEPVYGLELDRNHIFYTRRNGKPHWTGNSNAFGAKGVVTVRSDNEVPQTADGRPVDAVFNLASITSRVAPGLIDTMAMGKLALKKGKALKVKSFFNGDSTVETRKALDAAGVSDTEDLYDPVSGATLKGVTTGPLYFSRLAHSAEDKESHAGEFSGHTWNMQPGKTRDDDQSKRVGNLATNALLSHGAFNVLEDIATVRSVKNDEYWTNLKLNRPVPTPKEPFVFNKFLAHLEGAGAHVSRDKNLLSILPQTDRDIAALSKGAIKNPGTLKVTRDKVVAEEGGLFDETLVGVTGANYNHIDLETAIPNPISEDALRNLLGMTRKHYEEAIADGSIGARLKALNVDAELAKWQKVVSAGNKSELDKAVKAVKFLRMLKAGKMTPGDLMLSKVPVIPAQYRPLQQADGMTLSANANYLYRDLMLTNSAIARTEDPELKKKAGKATYDAVKAVYGLGDPVSRKSVEKNVQGLLGDALGIRGGSPKFSLFQSNVVNKPAMGVGRATIVPDASLDLDQISIPHESAWKLAGPYVIQRLVRNGVPAVQAREYVEKRNPLATQALKQVLADRVLLMERAPTLHKFSIQAVKPVLNADPNNTTLGLNPLLTKGYGADFDGDAVNYHNPATEQAQREAKDKMLPSRNLLSPKNMAPMFVPTNEAALGLNQASNGGGGRKVKAKNEQEVLAMFNAGKVGIHDEIDFEK